MFSARSLAFADTTFAPDQTLARPVDEIYTQALREDGLLAGTMVATDEGWRPVEGIAPGDMVLTFDNGMQRVAGTHRIEIKRATVPSFKAFTMFIPAEAIGNRKDMLLMPSQEVIVECDRAEIDYGEPFVLIQALLLDGYRGIRKAPIARDLSIHMLTFENEQIIHTSGATLTSCRAAADFSPLEAADRTHVATGYSRLTSAQIKQVAHWLKQEAAEPVCGPRTVDDLYAAWDARLV
jgi:hypothetical protein